LFLLWVAFVLNFKAEFKSKMNLNPLADSGLRTFKLYRIFMVVDQKVKQFLVMLKPTMVFISHISSIELPVIKKS
jgi:hypothetical protein